MSITIPCPSCGSMKSSVRDTRKAAQGGLRRRRLCLDCDKAWSTIELPYAANIGRNGLLRKALILQKAAEMIVEAFKATGLEEGKSPGPPRKEKVKP